VDTILVFKDAHLHSMWHMVYLGTAKGTAARGSPNMYLVYCPEVECLGLVQATSAVKSASTTISVSWRASALQMKQVLTPLTLYSSTLPRRWVRWRLRWRLLWRLRWRLRWRLCWRVH
jgi:hypothetical protein